MYKRKKNFWPTSGPIQYQWSMSWFLCLQMAHNFSLFGSTCGQKKSWAPKNWCFWTVALEKTLESPLGSKEIEPVNSNGNQSWIFIGRTDAEAEAPILWPPWCKELTHFKRPWCWERLKMEGEGDNRGGDGWMASPTRWTWVWASSGSWWWTGKPDVLQSMGSQRVGHDWATELSWTEL